MRVTARYVSSHRCRLRIGAQNRIVVCGAGKCHGADGLAVKLGRHYIFSDEPIERVGVLAVESCINTSAKNVTGRLIQCTWLVAVQEPCCVLRDPMGKLVPGNVDVIGEILEDYIIAIAEDHSGAIPKRVIKTSAIVNIRVEV